MTSNSAGSKKRLAWILGLSGVAVVGVIVAVVIALMAKNTAPGGGSYPRTAPSTASFTEASALEDYSTKPGVKAFNLLEGLDESKTWSAFALGSGNAAVVWIRSTDNEVGLGDDVIRGIDFEQVGVSWQLSLAEEAGHPATVAWNVYGEGLIAVVALDPNDDTGPRTLIVFDAVNGTIVSKRTFDAEGVDILHYLGQGVLVYEDVNKRLHAVKTDDLNTELWSAAPAIWTAAEENYYGHETVLADRYVATVEGYLNLLDGSPTQIAPDAGTNGVYLASLAGSETELVRVSLAPDQFLVEGFDPETNSTSWSVLAPEPENVKLVGEYLVVYGNEAVVGYQLADGALTEQWSVPCEFCFASYADTERIVLSSRFESTESMVVSTATGAPREGESLEGNFHTSIDGGDIVYFLNGTPELVALKRDDFTELWRTNQLNAEVRQAGSALTLYNESHGMLGIVGAEGDDWSIFES